MVYILFGGKIPNVSPEPLWFLFKAQTWGANKRIRSEPCFFTFFPHLWVIRWSYWWLKSSCNSDMFHSCFWFRVFCGSLAVVYNLYVTRNIPCQVQQTMPGPLFSGIALCRRPTAPFEPPTATKTFSKMCWSKPGSPNRSWKFFLRKQSLLRVVFFEFVEILVCSNYLPNSKKQRTIPGHPNTSAE